MPRCAARFAVCLLLGSSVLPLVAQSAVGVRRVAPRSAVSSGNAVNTSTGAELKAAMRPQPDNSSNGGYAKVVLSDAAAALTQVSDTPWTLTKTGAIDARNANVSWTITATSGTAVGDHLLVQGYISVRNIGTGPATIGNIVVNLQTRPTPTSPWTTISSDIADATHGDAATTALVVAHASLEGLSTFSENSASGPLSFTNEQNDSAFSLVPEVTIPSRTTVRLLFSATFDNSILHLAAKTKTRTEVIVTFGNHAEGGPDLTDNNVDINGNGIIDPDEATVRSVSAHFRINVPAVQVANKTITLSDTAANIATAGTVTILNPVFTLGATTGTVTAGYDQGANGGSITNCAQATGIGVTTILNNIQFQDVAPVQLQACNTVTVGAHSAGWQNRDFFTFDQVQWGNVPKGTLPPGSTSGMLLWASMLLENYYNSVYLSTSDVFSLGIPNSGFSSEFTSSDTLRNYLPQSGPPGIFDGNLVDPTTTSAGAMGGETATLKLNTDFSDAGLLPAASGLKFGDLTLCGLATDTDLNTMSVRQFLGVLNTALSGGATTDSINDLDTVGAELNGSFEAGIAGPFAQQHLARGVNSACGGWQNGDLTTFTQPDYAAELAPVLLQSDYNSVYLSTSDIFTLGLPNSGFSSEFTSYDTLLTYLPDIGPLGIFDGNLVDPTTTASGAFGGVTAALKLNIDFDDAGVLPAASGLKFGDLSVCGLTTDTDLNGLSVRQFLGVLNTALSGGAMTDSIADLATIASDVDYAFDDGFPSTFAQQHLVNGPCP